MSDGSKTFSKDLLVFGEDNKAKELAAQKKTRRSMSDLGAFKHENKFIPVRKGHGDPIGKYPSYIEKVTTEKIVEKKSPEKDEKLAWKSSGIGYTRPSPSVSLIFKNLNMTRRK